MLHLLGNLHTSRDFCLCSTSQNAVDDIDFLHRTLLSSGAAKPRVSQGKLQFMDFLTFLQDSDVILKERVIFSLSGPAECSISELQGMKL